jgi:hypothetical protein
MLDSLEMCEQLREGMKDNLQEDECRTRKWMKGGSKIDK